MNNAGEAAEVREGEVVEPVPYVRPELVPLGEVAELTLGSRFDDTADMKRYYA